MKQRYENRAWDDYAHAHLTVLTSYQLEVYTAIAEKAQGSVIDLGCGSARIAPFLKDRSAVADYLGVDSRAEMINASQWLIDQLNSGNFSVRQSNIEEVTHQLFDFGISVHSYYAWPDPDKVLRHIFKLIATGGDFVLVTPNPSIDMIELAKQTDKELVSHPNYPAFRSQNIALAGNERALFSEMDTLIHKCKQAGFKIQSCHQHFYAGGANFIHMTK